MKGKIVHIEIPADDTQRAMKFWGDLTGWQFKNYAEGQEGAPEYNMFEGEPGGAIHPAMDGKKGLTVYFETDDIDAERDRISEARRQRRRQDAGPDHGLVRPGHGHRRQQVRRLAGRRERTDARRHGRAVRSLELGQAAGRRTGALARGDRGSPPPRALHGAHRHSSPSGTTPRLKLATCSGAKGGRASASRRWNARNR